MFAALILSTLAVISPVIPADGPESIQKQRDVAFEELNSGQPAAAVASLEESLRQDPKDPATLINLGTAYARLGDSTRAEQAFRSAMTSSTRYQVELADGSWADSRTAARRALQSLETTRSLAALSD